jgi:histidine triad (HIT) family protein
MSSQECPFCRIIQGELDGAIVFADAMTLAFLDHSPVFPGHTLLVPREHYQTLADLPAHLLSPFFANVQLLARAVEQGMQADGTLILINNKVSQSVPHVHVHIIPRRWHDGLRGFLWPRQRYRDQMEMDGVRDVIRAAVEKLQS